MAEESGQIEQAAEQTEPQAQPERRVAEEAVLAADRH